MNVVAFHDEAIRLQLPFFLLTAGIDHRQEPRRRPNGASFYQFLLVSTGVGVVESEGKTERLEEGMVLFTSKNTPVNYYGLTSDFRTSWVSFDGQQTEAVLSYLNAERVAVLRSEASRLLISDLYRRAERHATATELSELIYRLIVTFFEERNEEKKLPHLRIAKEFAERNYERDLSVAEIADAVGISESLLYRVFRAEEGTTPIAYLRSVRLRHAKELLIESGERKIAEIAARVGFSDAAYFSKIFRADTGMTPRTYRSRYGQ